VLNAPEEKKGKVRGNEERGREEGGRRENEEKRGEKILRERFSRARIGAHRCAHSNRNVVFLLSQVSHFGGIRRKKLKENAGKIRAKNDVFRCRRVCIWKIVSMFC